MASSHGASLRAFSLGGVERTALPHVPVHVARKDVHDGFARVQEGGLLEVVDAYAQSVAKDGPTDAPPADAALQAEQAMSTVTYTYLLRAALLTWSAEPVPLQERVAFADWLRTVFMVRSLSTLWHAKYCTYCH
jgi:hypothetical protein